MTTSRVRKVFDGRNSSRSTSGKVLTKQDTGTPGVVRPELFSPAYNHVQVDEDPLIPEHVILSAAQIGIGLWACRLVSMTNIQTTFEAILQPRGTATPIRRGVRVRLELVRCGQNSFYIAQ